MHQTDHDRTARNISLKLALELAEIQSRDGGPTANASNIVSDATVFKTFLQGTG